MIKRFCDICGAEIRSSRYRSVRLVFGGNNHYDKDEACAACENRIKEAFNAVIADLKHAPEGGAKND